MRVFIKEYDNLMDEAIRVLLKENVIYQRLPEKKIDYAIDDIVIFSKKDLESKSYDCFPARHIIYEDVYDQLASIIMSEYYSRYDYYYLRNRIIEGKGNRSITNIITGSSYALFDVNEALIGKSCINLSLSSQDLYYSIKIINEIVKCNPNIRKVVLVCGYYYLFSDLSSARDDGEVSRISNIYYPLLKDVHNSLFLPLSTENLYHSELFDISRLLNELVEERKSSYYFNELWTREMLATRVWSEKSKKWSELTSNEKMRAAVSRATTHNKAMKYMRSLTENTLLLNKFVTFCNQENITVYVVTAPMSEYYAYNLNPRFKDIFYDVLKNLDGNVELIDMNDMSIFEDDDFNDMDHLNDEGSKKFTKIIITECGLTENEDGTKKCF